MCLPTFCMYTDYRLYMCVRLSRSIYARFEARSRVVVVYIRVRLCDTLEVSADLFCQSVIRHTVVYLLFLERGVCSPVGGALFQECIASTDTLQQYTW